MSEVYKIYIIYIMCILVITPFFANAIFLDNLINPWTRFPDFINRQWDNDKGNYSNKTVLNETFLRLDTKNDPLPNNLTVINEVQSARFRYINGNNRSYTKINDNDWIDLTNSIIYGNNEPDLEGGEIVFLFYAQENRTIQWMQFGKNNSYGGWGNSFGLVPNNIGFNDTLFNNGTHINMSALSSYLTLCEWGQKHGKIPEGCKYFADTSGRGPLFFTTGDIEGWLSATIHEGLQVFESFSYLSRSGSEAEFVNSSVHILIPITYLVGFTEGDQRKIFQEIFSGSLGKFVNEDPAPSVWLTESSALCNDGQCATANGFSGAADITMNTTFSSKNVNNTELNFVYSLVSVVGANNFRVEANNGTGWEIIFTDSGTDTLVSQSVILDSDYYNVPEIGLRFVCDVSQLARICYVDNVVINGTAIITSTENVSGFDSEICFSDGSRGVNGRCEDGLFYEEKTDTTFMDTNINVSKTIYYGALQANSPHLFKEDPEVGYTRMIVTADNGIQLMQYWHYDISTDSYVLKAEPLIDTPEKYYKAIEKYNEFSEDQITQRNTYRCELYDLVMTCKRLSSTSRTCYPEMDTNKGLKYCSDKWVKI